MRTMKLKFLIVCIFVCCFVGMTASPAAAITVLWQAANTEIDLTMPYGSLEFDNPLAGTEMVKEYAVKEWRDAGYAFGVPPWYEDWFVNDPVNIDGYANEIWMRWGGHSIWTSTTVPSSTVSIHLHGDHNDGLADILVDGILVARLDMGTLPPAVQNACVIVKNLANITHHIRVNDLGVGPMTGDDDVATMGAAALEKKIKWSQPPIPTDPQNLYYGWNEVSDYNGPQIVADDWQCDNDDPVTDIHWWGSYRGWTDDVPPVVPESFHITFWNDTPDPNPDDPNTFSHPNEVVWEIDCSNFDWSFAGWDYDPRTNCFEACYFFEQYLTEAEYFYQHTSAAGTPSIYWISIAAKYPADAVVDYPWGWKTLPRKFNDDAVRINKPTVPHIGDKYVEGEPIYWPDPTQSWDMAFELTALTLLEGIKWEQRPEPDPQGGPCFYGWDEWSEYGGQQIVADDWACLTPEPVTDIHWWGSYIGWDDENPPPDAPDRFQIAIWTDLPSPPEPFSHPREVVWQTIVPRSELNEIRVGCDSHPVNPGVIDSCFYYEFKIPESEWFYQEPVGQPTIYWLSISAIYVEDPVFRWGWKTRPRDPDSLAPDDAVRIYDPTILDLGFPYFFGEPIEWLGESYDTAFVLTTQVVGPVYYKWRQPPEPYTPKAYDGWNEYSVYNSTMHIVADDWRCDTDDPVTDIHWWGSFIGWPCEEPPEIPDSFHIAIWTDVPAGADPDPEVWFSHPGVVIWETDCNNFTYEFDGWDIDPRYPPNNPPEACFKFEQDLREEEWFEQKPGDNIYWISIAARYPTGTSPLYPWGWKTRLRDQDSRAPDDAVRIFDPTAPVLWSPYIDGEPIWLLTPSNSYDMAFELTTKEKPPKPPVPHLKWSQPPIEVDPNSEEPVYSGWDEKSYIDQIDTTRDPLVADDYRCLGNMPVTSIHWWGSHYGLVEPGATPLVMPIGWKIGFWTNVPAPDGEWDIGDPNKMHYPQLPDPNGWDLNITGLNKSADDWMCTKSGYVTDIHFWYSWLGDDVGIIQAIKVEIYDNVPEDPGDPASFSHPGNVQWSQDFFPGEFTTRLWGKGNQGFITPGGPSISDDHDDIYQCNIVNIPGPFYQNIGEIYWLAISIELEPVVNTQIGWKTSGSKQYEDDAVYLSPVFPVSWEPWYDPITGNSLDLAFVITGDVPYSHPEKMLWQIKVPEDRVKVEEVGTDFYHHLHPNDVTYQYTLYLEPNEVFWQGDYLEDTTDDIFWLSIAAIYSPDDVVNIQYPWGWKTRPWSWMDDAVRFTYPGSLEPGIVLDPIDITPIKDPLYSESFDVAFELDTDPNYIKWEQPFIGIRKWPHYEDEKSMAREVTSTEHIVKWAQSPDITETGVDVDATNDGTAASTQLLADDFPCDTTEPITNIHVYGSWLSDDLPNGDPAQVNFTLSIHKDIPPDPLDPTSYSMPGDMLWSEEFLAGDFTVEPITSGIEENYYIPCTGQYFPLNHTGIFKYNFYPDKPFVQQGSSTDSLIYWLDVQAEPISATAPARFGWKSRDLGEERYMDGATWVVAEEPYNGNGWRELRYPAGPSVDELMDLAFEITSDKVTTEFIIERLVADDWRCDQNTPVTDAVWWGSYIGYRFKPCHGPFMPLPVKPDYFWLTMWTDVPADEDSAIPFSHPNEIIWKYKAYDYDEVLVGYDKHPHAGIGINVAICGAPSDPLWNDDVQAKLLATGQFNTVDIIDVHNITPTLAQLLSYNAVLVYSDSTYADSNALGNVMADYVDAGGGVVCAMFEIGYGSGPNPHPLCQMRGRWDAQGYYVIPRTAQYGPPQATLGTVYDPTHPIMQGVSSFDGGSFSARPTPNTVIPPGATRIADWSDRSPLVVTKTIGGVKRADLGLYPPSSDSRSDFWVSSTDGALLMANALRWVAVNQPISRRREPVFRYSVRIPKEHWFMQKDVNDIYWFSVVAVYEADTDPLYDWGWTNHKYVFNDDAVAGSYDPAVDVWTWNELYDQLGDSEDMSFILFTDPDCLSRNATEYSDWVAWNRPKCWCYSRQCRGDGDGLQTGPFWVGMLDLNDFVLAFNRFDAMLPPNGICYDADHTKTGPFRVGMLDLNNFVLYFNQFVVQECDQFPINTGPYNFWTTP